MRDRLHLFLSMATDYARRNPDWARLLYLEIWPSVLIEEARVRRAVDDFGRIVVAMLRERFAATGVGPLAIDAIALCRQDTPNSRFRIIGRWELHD